MQIIWLALLAGMIFGALPLYCQDRAAEKEKSSEVIIRPDEIDDVLVNPGIGFTTFQRFNGDELNPGLTWTEGQPIVFQPSRGTLKNQDYPDTSIAYFRICWRFIEPEKGKYRWELIDQALETAKARSQTLILRLAPYGGENETPDWFQKLTAESPAPKSGKPRPDPENPAYAKYFGGLVRAMARRYDGDPRLELVDISIAGAWGEGSESESLSKHTIKKLFAAYLESFRRTPLVVQPDNWSAYRATFPKGTSPPFRVGLRFDCLGDLRCKKRGWCHMYDVYPQAIIQSGLQETWKTRPVSLEACWTLGVWEKRQWDIDYIIEQSLKWHLSSFNAKSSKVPLKWQANVNRWLNRMGYRFVLRKFSYPSVVKQGQKLSFTSWWENKGVAPPYRDFPVAFRLTSKERSVVVSSPSDVRKWLPGDTLYDGEMALPKGLAAGEYTLAIGLLDPETREPLIRLAIAGRASDGWYPLGKIQLVGASGRAGSSRPESASAN